MATDGPDPTPCRDELLDHGEHLFTLDGSSNAVETWVRALATWSGAKLDWHYVGGRACVLFLGDGAARQRVITCAELLLRIHMLWSVAPMDLKWELR